MSGRDTSVSVIIPTYNRAALLERCLRSLRRCDIPGLEIIVVDDGGTDETAPVAQAHGAVYIRQTNAGPAAARNHGFSASRGRYVTFIDSDDEWADRGAARLFEQGEANPDVAVIFADSSMGDDASGFVSFVDTYGTRSFFELPHTSRPAGLRILERRPFFLQLSTRNVMFLGSTLFRREFLAAIGGFNPALCGAADWDVFMRAAAAGIVAYSEGPAVSRYYKHAEGMSTNSDHMEEDFIRALDSVGRRSALDPTERSHVIARIKAHVFGWAWAAYDRGDFPAARKRLLLGRDLGYPQLLDAAYLTATYLPPAIVSALRRARRRLTHSRTSESESST